MTAEQLLRIVRESGFEQIRIAWCDLHGQLRAKSLMPRALQTALRDGIGMVGTLALKDTSDRTAFKVFESGGLDEWPMLRDFAQASNFTLRPVLGSYQQLPWTPRTAWLQAHLCDAQGVVLPLDTRGVLQRALAALQAQGLGLRCGLEMEFHIYKIENARPQTDPDLAGWPGLPPAVSMIHPGYELLSERWLDMAHAPLEIVRSTCAALGLPLTSLEIEFGPSQVEAVFAAQDALAAADTAVLFRSAVTQALQRAGYHASFMCRPPFPQIMSSGWHLHQSLVDEQGRNAFTADTTKQTKENSPLSPIGMHWLAGLLAHASAQCAFANPMIDAYERFRPNALAPTRINWGKDSRASLLRVIPAGPGTRIENRLGSPAANPYLYIASQIAAGLDGLQHQRTAPPADAHAQSNAATLPADLSAALAALQNDAALAQLLGADFITYYTQIKQQELARYAAAADKVDWLRREYFGRY
jgi:glutamine synthetase